MSLLGELLLAWRIIRVDWLDGRVKRILRRIAILEQKIVVQEANRQRD